MNMEAEANENSSSLRMSLRERPRKQHAERKLRERNDEMKFLNNFNPEKSNREKRKHKRKMLANSRCVYDENGCIRASGLDLCDCMDANCPGCWFDCVNCGSPKCGLQCRVNRKFFYESVSFDGKDSIIANRHIPSK